MKKLAAALICAGVAFATTAEAKVEKAAWGETPGHQKVDLYTLTSSTGLTAKISTYGAALTALQVPDKSGAKVDVVRGFDTLDGYLNPGTSHYGAVIGRYANRIKGAQFTLDGTTYHLPVNSMGNTIHGGPLGFDKRVWTAHAHGDSVTLTYVSPDGEMNFPGTLTVTAIYTVVGNTLRLEYRASTDKPTVINFTNHAYFNLKGAGNGDILDHQLTINADTITLSDPDHTANGQIRPVAGTGFDFRKPMRIGDHINDSDPQIAGDKPGGGYDQNFIVNGAAGTLRLAARAVEPVSGRVMECWTTEPGVQLYTANGGGTVVGKGGISYVRHGEFTLETQHFANAPNIPSFPSTELKPGQKFREVTEFRFSNEK